MILGSASLFNIIIIVSCSVFAPGNGWALKTYCVCWVEALKASTEITNHPHFEGKSRINNQFDKYLFFQFLNDEMRSRGSLDITLTTVFWSRREEKTDWIVGLKYHETITTWLTHWHRYSSSLLISLCCGWWTVFLAQFVDIDSVSILSVEHEVPGRGEHLFTLTALQMDSLPTGCCFFLKA